MGGRSSSNQFSSEDCKYAVVYPIRPEHIARLVGGKDIFCKYIGKHRRTKICRGTRLLFYASGGSYEIKGEGIVERIAFHSLDELLKLYRKRLFITEDELVAYKNKFPRPAEEPLLVLALKKIRKFETPIRIPKAVTMAGLSLTKDQYEALIGEDLLSQ